MDNHPFDDGVKTRQGELTADSLQLTASVGYGFRNTPERLAVSRKPIADSVETMLTADGLRPTAYSPDKDEMRIVADLPKAKAPPQSAVGLRPGPGQSSVRGRSGNGHLCLTRIGRSLFCSHIGLDRAPHGLAPRRFVESGAMR